MSGEPAGGLLSPGLFAQLSCLLEASAEKPGNVTPTRSFEDSTFLDFAVAAAALGEPMERAAERGVGITILEAVERTRALTGKNVNLGLVLLLAPLAAAAGRRRGPVDRAAVQEVLAGLAPEDGERVYRAIVLARPGGLGRAAEEDVRAGPPARPLIEAMALASDRDLVARQYAEGFREVFEEGLPILVEGLERGLGLEAAIIRLHLELMARHPDSLIARKCGAAAAGESARLARAALERGWPGGAGSAETLAELDRWLRAEGHRRNPGTTADLVGASLFPAIANGIIPLPLEARAWRPTACG